MKIVIATQNKGKLSEYKQLLGDKFQVLSAADVGFFQDVDETGSTFEENSYLKAKALYDFCNIPALADDSGLMVDALNGAPGVFSARYAGLHGDDKKNYTLLLKNLEDVENRSAHFKTAITFILNENTVFTASGETYGKILDRPDGDKGFGYDPVFFSDELNKSFGICQEEEKNSVSHRSKAVNNLLEILKNSQIIDL